MIATVKSRQRIIDHGEVFTPPGLVNDMLDLVAHECERIDARFLEPACGDGNFLAEVLRRRLAVVDRKHRRSMRLWEQDALLGLACLYGIEFLFDNVNACRDRLHGVFADAYTRRFGLKTREAVLAAARFIVRCNIHHGDALKMTTVADKVYPALPLVFTEWSMLGKGYLKRRRYEYRDLSQPPPDSLSVLFASGAAGMANEDGKPVFIPHEVGEASPIHYLKLSALQRNYR